MSSGFESIDMIDFVDQLDAYDPVTSDIISTPLNNLLSMQSIITHVSGSDEFRSISAINSKLQYSITPEELIIRLCFGLKTVAFTFKATTHQYIHTTCFLTKRFCTDKDHLCYKHLSWQYCTFYTDLLRVKFTYICDYCGGLLFTNKIGFKKFFHFDIEKGENWSNFAFLHLIGQFSLFPALW